MGVFIYISLTMTHYLCSILNPAIIFVGAAAITPLTSAEKMKRYRVKLRNNPEKYEQVKQKDRERWHQRRLANKIKTISELSPSDQCAKRIYWRKSHERRKK